jgi:hypothetical protein
MNTPKIEEFDARFRVMNEKVASKEEREKPVKTGATDKLKEI